MIFQVPVNLPGNLSQEDSPIKDEQITIEANNDIVSSKTACVSKSHIRMVVRKIAKILAAQGVSCCECPQSQYKLYSLSDCEDGKLKYSLRIDCPDGQNSYQFKLTMIPTETIEKTNMSETRKVGTCNE